MSRSNFEASMVRVKVHEGGYINHSKDPGGETNFGISKRSYPKVNIKGLSWEAAKAIYRRDFWDKIHGDALPAGVDFVTLDPAINSGVSQGAKFLQRAVGVTPDGKIGVKTLTAVSMLGPVYVIREVSKRRLGFLSGLRTWGTFGRGWSRRVAEVEAAAVVMAGAPAMGLMADVKTMQRNADANAKKASVTTAGAASTPLLTDLPTWNYAVIAVAMVLIVATFMGRRIIEQQRAAAYSKELQNVS